MLTAVRHRRNADIRAFLAIALALTTMLRVLAAPAALAQAPEGMIALCSGGTVVYVSIDGSEPPKRAASGELCPIVGLTAALAPVDDAAFLLSATKPVRSAPPILVAPPAATGPAGLGPRAPPRL